MSVNEDPTPPAASAPAASSVPAAASSMSAAASSAPTLHPLVALLGQAQRELNAFTNPDGVVGEAASDPTIGGWVRAGVYSIIQAQTKQFEGAIYNDLKCPVCMELFNNSSSHTGREQDVITIGCGHSVCRGCLRGWRTAGHSDCPTCRTANTVTAASIEVPKSITISNIIERLKPRAGAGAGGSRRKQKRATKFYKRSRSTRRK